MKITTQSSGLPAYTLAPGETAVAYIIMTAATSVDTALPPSLSFNTSSSLGNLYVAQYVYQGSAWVTFGPILPANGGLGLALPYPNGDFKLPAGQSFYLVIYSIATPSMKYYTAPVGGTAIVADGSGGAWFSAGAVKAGNSSINHIAADGTQQSYHVPGNYASTSIALDAGGNVWFTDTNDSTVGLVTSSGTVTSSNTPTSSIYPSHITIGPDGRAWFTTNQGLGAVSTSGAVSEYPDGKGNVPRGPIVVGHDGALWYPITDSSASLIRMTTTGQFTVDTLPTAIDTIAEDTAGNIWFAGVPSGFITESHVITALSGASAAANASLTPIGSLVWGSGGNSVSGSVINVQSLSSSGAVGSVYSTTPVPFILQYTYSPSAVDSKGRIWFSSPSLYGFNPITIFNPGTNTFTTTSITTSCGMALTSFAPASAGAIWAIDNCQTGNSDVWLITL